MRLDGYVALGVLFACGTTDKPSETAKAATPGQLPIATSCGGSTNPTELIAPSELVLKTQGCREAKASTSTTGAFKSNTDATCQASLSGKDPVCVEWHEGPQKAWGLWDTASKTQAAECYCAH